MKVLFINGPNLNLLGTREPAIYGSTTLATIEQNSRSCLAKAQIDCEFVQSNSEHEIIEWVQAAPQTDVELIIINPAAFTHTSVAIRDSLAAVAIPFIEVHLSNPHAREPFRKNSYFSDLAIGVIAGFGEKSYQMACDAAISRLTTNTNKTN